MISYVKGDATDPIGEGNKIIIHVCNNRGGWGRGFVVALSKKWKEPEEDYRRFMNISGLDKQDQLGVCRAIQVEPDIWVINMIAQDGYKSAINPVPLNYEALQTCLYGVLNRAKDLNASIHAPRFGCGLAGGDWNEIERMIDDTLEKQTVYIYDL